jgi:hypothetical protein
MRAASIKKMLGIMVLVFAMVYSALALIDPSVAASQQSCCGNGFGCSEGQVCCNHLRMCDPPCSQILKHYCLPPAQCVYCVKTP